MSSLMLNFAVLVSIKNWGGYHASPIHSVQIAFLKNWVCVRRRRTERMLKMS
jgi:hypothetical protein